MTARRQPARVVRRPGQWAVVCSAVPCRRAVRGVFGGMPGIVAVRMTHNGAQIVKASHNRAVHS